MGSEDTTQKVSELNNIFKELIGDAKSFAKDMVESFRLYFLYGVLLILFGIQTGWYNKANIIIDPVPLILMIVQIVAGIGIILRGLSLKKKYKRIFELNKKL
jgi:hypothetical protein